MLQNAQTQSADSLLPHAIGHFGHSPVSHHRFHTQLLDNAPHLLEDSYRLRYRVYCLERRFLPADDYPNQLEIDEFDRYSLHFGVVDPAGELAATGRVVRVGPAGLPLFRRCTIFPTETELYGSHVRPVEISRLSMSRYYGRRARRGDWAFDGAADARHVVKRCRDDERRRNEEMMVSLYRALYRASRSMGCTHLLAATEPSLQRLFVRYGFPFRQIGPQCEYFGPVAPYMMSVSDFDRVILSGRIPVLNDFLSNLEPTMPSGSPMMANA